MQITTIGLDLAKSVFQVHGVDATGQVVVRKSLRRSQMLAFFTKLPPCLVGIEACGTSHHWARELIKLGHEVRLMPPAYVKPYVKRGKIDAALDLSWLRSELAPHYSSMGLVDVRRPHGGDELLGRQKSSR